MKHNCSGYEGNCIVCDGILHNELCTSKKNPKKDCCLARHIMLWKQGIKIGIYDKSQDMLSAEQISRHTTNQE